MEFHVPVKTGKFPKFRIIKVATIILITFIVSQAVSSFPLETAPSSDTMLASKTNLDNEQLLASQFLPRAGPTNGNLVAGRGRKSRQMPFIIYGGCSPYTGFGPGGGFPQYGGGNFGGVQF
ncbi:uncharacterized protein LOC110860277 [Folsomia candida]|uniref:Uncharacterized protein n=1 Tax=Folsomia candida TaxID=158441 RepID=A0A226D6A2_FOLCA|nr:uncharacterized protein LOC110860277 [Folsomia candida]OXA41075.1 hypothetical protein Fcan01_24164 [Folsomia candida]